MKPQVDIISLGGTIGMAMVAAENGVEPRFTAEDLIKTVPEISNFADLSLDSTPPPQ